jgi:hypothetical protein
MDLLCQEKRPGVLCSNYLKSCYDRIVHTVASLILQGIGLQESEIVCMFSTLQNLEHTIRTAYGDSSKNYGGNLWTIPMQGVYQGNGARPIIWAVVSSPLLRTMKEEGFGTFFKTSLSGQDIQIVGYAFVDDTDLIQTGRTSQTTSEEVHQAMQNALNMWEGLIRATGGALVVKKSSWWLIDFRWNADGSVRYVTKADHPSNQGRRWYPQMYTAPRSLRSLWYSRYLSCTGWQWQGTNGGYAGSGKNLGCSNLHCPSVMEQNHPCPTDHDLQETGICPLPVTSLTEAECDIIL